MMKIGKSIEVIDPYEWLPGHGENSIQIYMHGTDLSVVISYDGQHGEKKKELLFEHTVAFYKAAFPGPNLLNMHCSENNHSSISMSSLAEYPDSEAAQAWREHFQGIFSIKHYRIQFLSENITLVVFSTGVQVRDMA